MKRFRPVNLNTLTGGLFYIRAVVNCHGACWIETSIKVNGVPRASDSKTMKGSLVVDTPSKYRNESFIGDLGVGRGRSVRLDYTGVPHIPPLLFPFSHKLKAKLDALVKDPRAFCEFLSGHPISALQWDVLQADWEWQRHMDDEMFDYYD
jgi:hypothetical protein